MRLTCCICINNIAVAGASKKNGIPTEADEQACTIPCGHVFHHRCLSIWLRGKHTKTCPRCRARCAESQMVKLFLNCTPQKNAKVEARVERLKNKLKAMKMEMREQELVSAEAKAHLKLVNFRLKNSLTAARKINKAMTEQNLKDQLKLAKNQSKLVLLDHSGQCQFLSTRDEDRMSTTATAGEELEPMSDYSENDKDNINDDDDVVLKESSLFWNHALAQTKLRHLQLSKIESAKTSANAAESSCL